jgi:hypothetical protein
MFGLPALHKKSSLCESCRIARDVGAEEQDVKESWGTTSARNSSGMRVLFAVRNSMLEIPSMIHVPRLTRVSGPQSADHNCATTSKSDIMR